MIAANEIGCDRGTKEVECCAKGTDGGEVGVALEGGMGEVVVLEDTVVEWEA